MPDQAPVHLPRPAIALLCSALVASMLALVGVSVASAAPAGAASSSSRPGRAHAEKVLARAERLLGTGGASERSSTGGSARAGGPVADRPRRDATLVLRDLERVADDLSVPDQRRASRLLERPATTDAIGTSAVVVHFNAAQVAPGYAQLVLDTATRVRDTYIAGGYRAPKSDGSLGGDSRFDIYLTDLSTTGAYGYCTSDEPRGGNADRWAYCVLDNSYRAYPGNPTQVLQVTLAHEYFHATQYAYDSYEDGWLLEGTAAWIEDYMYDDVNDNMQYAPYSPLAGPKFSLDEFKQDGFRQYGAWLWFRWLSEQYPDAQAGLPVIVRQIWEAAASGGKGKDLYSLQAINKVLKSRGTKLTTSYALFAAANRRPTAFYSEAAANGYPTAPLAGSTKLGKKRSKAKSFRLNHLSSATTRFVPKKLKSRKYRLRLAIDMADKKAGSAAVVTTYLLTGEVKTKVVKLNRRGGSSVRVPFSSSKVSAVEVTLANVSQRFTKCYRFAVTYSCYGKPVDQKVAERVRASVVR